MADTELTSRFGTMVFSEDVMRKRLPKDIYKRLSATIEDHDVDVKFKNAVKFLKDGNKVKVTIRFRGRQITHSEIGREVMKQFAERIKEYGNVERAPLIEGRNMTMLIAPREQN